MAHRVVEQLDEMIHRLEEDVRQSQVRIEGVRAFRELVAGDPAFVGKITELLLVPACNGVPSPERTAPARNPEGLKYERVRDFLLSRGNEWQSIRQVSDGTGMKRNAVTHVFYNCGHRNIFEHKNISIARVLWRVKPEVAAGKVVEPLPSLPANKEKEEEATEPARVGPKPKHGAAKIGPKPKHGAAT